MVRVVVRQLIITGVTALITLFVGGKGACISALLAGVCFIIPNTIFIICLHIGMRSSLVADIVMFGAIELVKIAMITGCVFLVFWLYRDVNWIAFLVSFVISFKSYIYLLSKLESRV